MPKATYDDTREFAGLTDYQLTEAYVAGYITLEQYYGSVKLSTAAAELQVQILRDRQEKTVERSTGDLYREMIERLIANMEVDRQILERVAVAVEALGVLVNTQPLV
jgi:hypothetical protein